MADPKKPIDPLAARQREVAQPTDPWAVFDPPEKKPRPPIPPLTEREAADPWLRAEHNARVAQRAVEDAMDSVRQPGASRIIFALPAACVGLIVGMILWPIRRPRRGGWSRRDVVAPWKRKD